MKARSISLPVVPVEAAPTLRFLPLLYSVIFFLIQGSFSMILVCNFIEILYLFIILLLYV
jgi:hypothetical protein